MNKKEAKKLEKTSKDTTLPLEVRVRALIAFNLGIDASAVSPNKYWHELPADSIDVVELVLAVEETFNLEMPDAEAETLHTVGDLIKWHRNKGSTEMLVYTDSEANEANVCLVVKTNDEEFYVTVVGNKYIANAIAPGALEESGLTSHSTFESAMLEAISVPDMEYGIKYFDITKKWEADWNLIAKETKYYMDTPSMLGEMLRKYCFGGENYFDPATLRREFRHANSPNSTKRHIKIHYEVAKKLIDDNDDADEQPKLQTFIDDEHGIVVSWYNNGDTTCYIQYGEWEFINDDAKKPNRWMYFTEYQKEYAT